jgi:hypothetical protein
MGNVNLAMQTNTQYTLLSGANHTLAISLALLILSVVVSYPLSDLFSLNQQIISHVLIIISASALKLAYVARCVAQNEIKKQEC